MLRFEILWEYKILGKKDKSLEKNKRKIGRYNGASGAREGNDEWQQFEIIDMIYSHRLSILSS